MNKLLTVTKELITLATINFTKATIAKVAIKNLTAIIIATKVIITIIMAMINIIEEVEITKEELTRMNECWLLKHCHGKTIYSK